MKKFPISLGFVLLFISPLFVNAQEAFVNISAGYNLPISTQNINSLGIYDYYSGGQGDQKTSAIRTSLGQGYSYNLGFGYNFTKHYGLDLQISLLQGAPTKATYENHFTDSWFYARTAKRRSTIFAQMLRFNPSFIISTGADSKKPLNAYAKMGLIIGLGEVILKQHTDSSRFRWDEREWVFSGDLRSGL